MEIMAPEALLLFIVSVFQVLFLHPHLVYSLTNRSSRTETSLWFIEIWHWINTAGRGGLHSNKSHTSSSWSSLSPHCCHGYWCCWIEYLHTGVFTSQRARATKHEKEEKKRRMTVGEMNERQQNGARAKNATMSSGSKRRGRRRKRGNEREKFRGRYYKEQLPIKEK